METLEYPCRRQTIEQFLVDGLSDAEQTAFEDHLERCDACRRCLDEMAAEGSWWHEARGFLSTGSVSPDHSAVERPTTGDETGEGPGSLFGLKSFLGPTDDPHMLGRLGGYEIFGIVGSGGMGVVLKAFDAPLNRYVAIKVLSPHLALGGAARQRFAREARAAAAVVHDNVMAIHAVAEANGLPFLVMPYVRGPSLEKRLRQTGTFSVVEILRIGMQIASGLAAAHAQGLVHRDIKPANILMEEGVERVWITDFGLARAIDDATLTRTGVIAGTPQYMSPEQAAGETVDHRSDLFSLGSVLYALCTGQPPFRASTTLAVLRRVEEDRPRPIREINPEIPDWLVRIIAKLHAKSSADRFQNASEVASLLEGFLAHLRQPTSVPAPDVPADPTEGRFELARRQSLAKADRWVRRIFWLPVAVLLGGLGMSAAALLQDVQPNKSAKSQEFYQDFRGVGEIPPAFKPFGAEGAIVMRDAEGLRLTIPVTRTNRDVAGVVLPCRFQGDFEITTHYEVLRAARPTAGHGIGFELYITTDTPRPSGVGFSRLSRVKEGEVYWASRMTTNEEHKQDFDQKNTQTTARSGQLRLVRAGEIVTFLVAEGGSGEFQKLFEFFVGTDDLTTVRVAASPGWAVNDVDVRVRDLRVRGFGTFEAGTSSREQSRKWLGATLILCAALTLIALAWLYVRRRQALRLSDTTSEPRIAKALVSQMAWPAAVLGLVGLGTLGYLVYPAAEPSALAYSRSRALGWGWLATAEIVGLLVTLSFVGVWAAASRRRFPITKSESGSTTTTLNPTLIEFVCSGCGKNFKVKAEWAGKKGKCVQCGQGMVVPTLTVDRPSPAVARTADKIARWRRPRVLAAAGVAAVLLIGLVAFNSRPTTDTAGGTVQRLKGHLGPVHNVRFTPDGKVVSASGWPQSDQTVRVWDVATGRELKRIETPSAVHSLDLTPDGRFALAGLSNGNVLHIDLEAGKILRSHRIHYQAVGWVAFDSDGQRAYSTSDEGTAKMWSLADGNVLQRVEVRSRQARAGVVLSEGRLLLTGDSKGALQIWDLTVGKEVKTIEMKGPWMIDGLSLSPDGRQIVVAGVGGVRVFDLESGTEVRHFQEETEEVHQAALSPDGRRLIAASMDGVVRLWDFETGNLVRVLGAHNGFAFTVAFSPDGRMAISGGGGEKKDEKFVAGSDHEIRLWNLGDVATAAAGSGQRNWLAWTAGVLAIAALGFGLRYYANRASRTAKNVRVGTGA